MSRELMICGPSGSGKSTSLRNLNPKTTFIVNCGKKELPFRGFNANYKVFHPANNPTGNLINSNNFDDVVKSIKYVGEKRPEIKTLIVDDFQFAMAAYFMTKIGDKGFEKFNNLGKGIWDTVEMAKAQRDDLMVVFICHTDTNYNADGVKETKAKTLGKVIDNVVNLDGLFTIILYTEAVKAEGKIQYKFRTSTNGNDTCKTPMDMFDNEYVDNDLVEVFKTIRAYYGIEEAAMGI